MTTKTFSRAELRNYTGTENWYRHQVARQVLYTDGVRYVAESAGAYWLIDEIALAQVWVPAVAAEEFQHWTLAVASNNTATLVCDNGNDNVVFTKKIEYTDFPAEGVNLYVANNTIMVPSEY